MSSRRNRSGLRVIVTLFAVVHFAACIAGSKPRQPLATIPVELVHGLPTTTVLIDGTPLRLYFDLGAFQALSLTTAELRRVNVSYLKETTAIRNGQDETLESRKFVAHHVSVSGFNLGDLQGAEAIFGGMVPPAQNGNVGLSAIGRYLFVLDYPDKEIRVYPSGDKAAFTAECGQGSFSVHVKDGIAISTMRTKFGDRKVIWDTGAADNFIRPSAVPSELRRGGIIDEPPFHDSTLNFVRLENVSIDSFAIGPQMFRLWAFKAPDVDAYLGTALFASRKVCLDLRAGRGGMQSSRAR
jgi:hypothetical protein